MEKQVQCPSCKSYKTESFKTNAIKFGLACIIGAFTVRYFFADSYIIPFCFGGLGVLCLINGLRITKEYLCKACNFKFKTDQQDMN